MLFKKYTRLASRRSLLIAASATVTLLTSNAIAAGFIDTDDHKESTLDNKTVAPFLAQGVPDDELSENGINFSGDGRGGQRMKLRWQESEYDGSRAQRGHEIKLEVLSNDELHTGFYLQVPTSTGTVKFPTNKNTIIWQLYCWNSAGCNNWTAHLEIRNNELWLSYRAACVTATQVKIMDDIPRGKEMAVQIYNDLSGQNNGVFIIDIDDVRIANLRNINYGFGSFNSQDEAADAVVGVKMGMYCADTSDYTNNEQRYLYLDNISCATNTQNVSSGQNAVDPRR